MSNDSTPHVGDVGTRYRIVFRDEDCDLVDLTGATVMFWYQAPGTSVRIDVAATPEPDQVANKGEAYYDVTTLDGIHDAAGTWFLQGQATVPATSVFHSGILHFDVAPNLPLSVCD